MKTIKIKRIFVILTLLLSVFLNSCTGSISSSLAENLTKNFKKDLLNGKDINIILHEVREALRGDIDDITKKRLQEIEYIIQNAIFLTGQETKCSIKQIRKEAAEEFDQRFSFGNQDKFYPPTVCSIKVILNTEPQKYSDYLILSDKRVMAVKVYGFDLIPTSQFKNHQLNFVYQDKEGKKRIQEKEITRNNDFQLTFELEKRRINGLKSQKIQKIEVCYQPPDQNKLECRGEIRIKR